MTPCACDDQANLPYVLWTLAYNLPFLASLLAVDLIVGYTLKGFLYGAINRNQLLVFLVVRSGIGTGGAWCGC